MWKSLTLSFAIAFIAVMLAIEPLRAILHRRRERLEGIAGTQDIAMWGTFIGLTCLLATLVCGVFWYFRG